MTTQPLSEQDRQRVAAKILELKKYQWVCSTLDCDGKPHKDMPYPHARANQVLTGSSVIFMRSGRGSGKTYAGSFHVANRLAKNKFHTALIMADTKIKAIQVCVEGPSGLLNTIPPYMKPRYSTRDGAVLLNNGSKAYVMGANDKDDIEKPRGLESGTVWAEEVGSWKYQKEPWDNLMFANRSIKGPIPQVIVTTTPRNVPLVKMLNKWAEDGRAKLITGSTFDNASNLAPEYVAMMQNLYGNSTIGRQELYGEMVLDTAGAIWTSELIDRQRVMDAPTEFSQIVVAVDPSGGGASECGIVVVAKTPSGRAFILEDASVLADADVWSKEVVRLYREYNATCVVAEGNFGRTLVITAIRAADASVRVELVTASVNKERRAEPVKLLFKDAKVFMVGHHGMLEAEMTTWIPPGRYEEDNDGILTPITPSSYSPGRIDAMVHGVTYLILQPRKARTVMRMS